jgi:truncated hemoglobin YjbI
VSDDFIGRLAADKQLARFLVGMSDNSKAHLRQLVVDQLCQATGGPCVYIGRDMKTAHKGLGITGSDWDLTVKALVGSLDKFKVPPKEKDELLAFASSPTSSRNRKESRNNRFIGSWNHRLIDLGNRPMDRWIDGSRDRFS